MSAWTVHLSSLVGSFALRLARLLNRLGTYIKHPLGPLVQGPGSSMFSRRNTIAGQYRPRPSDQAPPTKLNPYILSGRSLRKNPEEEDKNYEIGLTFLKDYDTMLKQFEQALNAKWPSNDKASLQSIARSNASIHFYSQSQSKRSRPVADEGGPFNKVSGSKRRQG
ncbi:hypothetical protein F5888DRAFT_1638069 [Russula emetica]|nr:hypothetical protein F5888DRAFT_1638069 [Russula emetica]